jgi:hypothetical protein
METTFVIRKEELDLNFLESIKKLFKQSRELQITISNNEDFGLTKNETKKEYLERLNKIAGSIDENTKRIEMSEEEFDNFSLNLL